MIAEKVKKLLEKQGYRFVGRHSAVKICSWCKKDLVDEGKCYKSKFYGISSFGCCQMSPAIEICQNKCLHCWRPAELSTKKKIEKRDADKPKEIIEKCIESQKKLLIGFKGDSRTNRKKFLSSQEPSQFAISLSGEPTLYPYLGELIEELRKKGKTSFLVTNGLCPRVLEKLQKKRQLPTQLYLSVNAPNKKLFEKITRSKEKNAWNIYLKTVRLFPKLKTRKVLRLTLIRDLNMEDFEGYAKLIKAAKPHFVEVKSYISVGFARKRLGYEKMPLHSEVKEFAKTLCSFIGMKILDEQKESEVVLIGNNKKGMKIKSL